MTTADDFVHALAELLAACGLATPDDAARVLLRSGSLELAIDLVETTVTVGLSGWTQRFTLSDDEDGADAAALALDLIGGALFGALQVVVDAYAGRPARFSLQVRRGESWQTVTTQGARPWNLLARRSRSAHLGACARPAGYPRRAVTALPWAPWAGEAGFFGAGPAAAASELPVDGELDLHNFKPKEVKPLVLAYLDACLARGITQVRIVHGKGVGNLRRTVHALLARHPRVAGFRLGGHGGGSWGATLVDLSPGPGADADGSSGGSTGGSTGA